MKFISLFSGIGGFDLGFERARMECIAQVEIDNHCLNVLERHWPKVRRFKDVKECGKSNLPATDLICGGFPCQDLSIAGKRGGLAGERSGLWFEFERIIGELAPKWVVIENVPSLLSSNKGRDFATILQALVKFGYGMAWRILDAQYFGVAQRRRRVFIVGHLGDGRAAQVLFEREGMSRDTPPRRETGKVSATLFANGAGTSRPAGTASETDFLIPELAHAVTTHQLEGGDPTMDNHCISGMAEYKEGIGTLRSSGGDLGGGSETIIAFNNRQDPIVSGDIAQPLNAKDNGQGIAWDNQQITSKTNRSQPKDEYSPTLNQAGQMTVDVRRLTPTECERLQGFPDGWTSGQSDTARYRQLGNAVCVPVIEWIGKRLIERGE